MKNKIKQAGAELCQAQVKLGYQARLDWVSSLRLANNIDYPLAQETTIPGGGGW